MSDCMNQIKLKRIASQIVREVSDILNNVARDRIMHTITIRIPTYEKNYDSTCEYLTDECHAHGKYTDGQGTDNIHIQQI